MSTSTDNALERAARNLREYGLTDNSKAWLQLLSALTEGIKDDLLHADLQTVPALQAQARQLRALQDVALSNIPTNGRA